MAAKGRKGMSLEQKRNAMLEIFHESADVFVLKDVEKLGIKKGINGQTIKEVLQSLVDDDLVKQEKIGASNYYWSFPSDASVKLTNQVSKAETDVAALKRRRTELQAAVSREQVSQQQAALRAELMAELRELRQQAGSAEATVASYRDQDPETVQAMQLGAEQCKAAANRWLDNLHCLLSWCKRSFPGQEHSLEAFFEENGFSDNMEQLA